MKTVYRIVLLILALIIPTAAAVPAKAADYVKWVDFTPTSDAMWEAMEIDRKSYEKGKSVPFTSLLALYSAEHGGNYDGYKNGDMQKLCNLCGEDDPSLHAANPKLYEYYENCYTAALGGMFGEYTKYTDKDGTVTAENCYGLRAYSPVAAGYYYNHYDDFGAARSYGYKRNHLGHDLMGSVGTPIVAVEAGYVEACGWNRFGGWRIGIRSFDGKRYYYYAHLRRDHPYNDIYEGKTVAAGEVIGYLGMTGYSTKENTNNIDTPHLHYGLQLIFDKSQKDGTNQIWLDMYELTKLLERNRAVTVPHEKERRSLSISYPDFMWD